MVEEKLEMTDKIGYLLLKKGIMDLDILERALQIKDKEFGNAKRNLGQILLQEFGFDHDVVFREIATLYAFKEIILNPSEYTEVIIIEMQKILEEAGEDVKQQLLSHKVLPFKFDDRIRDKLILGSVEL